MATPPSRHRYSIVSPGKGRASTVPSRRRPRAHRRARHCSPARPCTGSTRAAISGVRFRSGSPCIQTCSSKPATRSGTPGRDGAPDRPRQRDATAIRQGRSSSRSTSSWPSARTGGRSASGSAAPIRIAPTTRARARRRDVAGERARPGFLPDTREVRHDILDYYFEVQRFDRDLGRMLAPLERLGELDNTLVIVTSDNGMPFPRAKATVYDGGAHVPLAMRWPAGVRAGAVVQELVSLADLAPTILEAAGLRPLDVMTGQSVLGLIRGEPQPGRDRVVHRTGTPRQRPSRRPELSGPRHQNERPSVHAELPPRSLAGRRPASSTSPSARSAISTAGLRSPW